MRLAIDQPALFAVSSTPDWVVEWQNEVRKRVELQRRRDTAVPPPHHLEKRLATIQAGLTELALWLHDLVRNGLAAARHKPKSYWFNMANRLVDAQAPGVAAELRQLAAISTNDADWAETILRRCGRLYLLIQGFQQFETLSPEIQADLQTAVGWQTRGAALVDGPGIRDHWHILGQETVQTGRRHVQSIWLWGEHSNRAAQISHIAHGQRYKNFSLVTGTVLDARLKFHVGTTPIRAQIIEHFDVVQPEKPPAGYVSLCATAVAFNQALAANPWLNRFPVLITAVPHPHDSHWQLHDESGVNLLLPTHYKQCWHLLALSGGRPLPIFGLFDGQVFTPLSVWSDGRYLPLHILRGVA